MNSTWAITQIADGIHFVQGPASNWVILVDQLQTSLIDCGYPGDWPILVASLRAVGREPDDVGRLLVTHAHADHIGSAERLRRDHQTKILACGLEAQHVRRTVIHQVTRAEVAAHAADERVRAWMGHAIAAGGLDDVAVSVVTEIPPGIPAAGALGPVPHVVAGHTPGHTVYELAAAQVVVTGDALVSGHPVSGVEGPQMLHPMFHTNLDQAEASLAVLAGISGAVILPGHGPAIFATPAAAVAARFRGSTSSTIDGEIKGPVLNEETPAVEGAAGPSEQPAVSEVAAVLREWMQIAGIPCEARPRLLREMADRQASGSCWSSAS